MIMTNNIKYLPILLLIFTSCSPSYSELLAYCTEKCTKESDIKILDWDPHEGASCICKDDKVYKFVRK